MAERKKRVGRPTKPGTAGLRNSLGLRVTADIKRKLEAAALKSGRSQSQEAEFRIEQSFLEERAHGGRELHGLLLLMVGAAEIIQSRTEKSWLSDWETSIAVRAAWKTLVAAVVRPPAELIQHFERDDELPPPPELPTRPSPPRRGLLSALIEHDSAEAKAYVAEIAATEKTHRKYDRLSAKYERKLEALRQENQAWRDRFISYQDLGKDVAAELLLRR